MSSPCRSKRSHRSKTPCGTLSQTDRLPAKDRDDLNNGAMIQRQVSGRINNRDEGIGARITRILDDQRNFKIDNPDAQKQLEDMLARLAAIRDQNLGPAEQGLTRATKSLDARNSSPPDAQPVGGASEPSARPDAAERAESKTAAPPRLTGEARPSQSREHPRRARTPPRAPTNGGMLPRRTARAEMHRRAVIKTARHRREATKRARHRREATRRARRRRAAIKRARRRRAAIKGRGVEEE